MVTLEGVTTKSKEHDMNKKSATIMNFILIIIVMFFLFPKSCSQEQGNQSPKSLQVLTYPKNTAII